MILKRLVELTERLDANPPEGYSSLDSGYQPAFITKIVRLKSDGTFRDVVPATGITRNKREGLVLAVPREAPMRTVAIVPRLIADNPNYVLGKAREKDKADQVSKRHAAYRGLLEDCVTQTQERSAKAILRWLEEGGAERLRDSTEIADDDEITFEVDGVRPTDLPAIKKFWAGRSGSSKVGTCLVTGDTGPIVDRMPAPIKGIPKGQMSGTALVSVNNPAGESYGLKAALNSPISPYAAERAGNALNYLLSSPIHSLRIADGVYIYWTRNEQEFSWDWLQRPQPDQVKKLLESAHAGRVGAPTSQGPEKKDFFVLSLSANAARAVVRDYHETTLDAVKVSLANWFALLSLVEPDGGEPKPTGLFRLAASLYREAKDIPPHLPNDLLRTAITGAPIPKYVLALAVKRNLATQGPYQLFQGRRSLSVDRLALIKATLPNKENIKLESLNRQHPNPAYHCGRLLAVLERIQKAAIHGINATVADRCYGSACASPASIMGNLLNDAQAHLSKLRKDHKAKYLENDLMDVLASMKEFPKTLSMPDQGLFALGFYHQKADDRFQAAKYRESQNETPEGD